MYVTNLESFLVDYCDENDKSKTVLIDGLWGCGKTHNIRNFINSSNRDIIYLSLFGVNDKEEVSLLLSEYLDSSFVTTINGKCSIRSSIEERDYCGTVIVLDDLERTNNQFFTSICGMVDSLSHLGFKVICVCDSSKIKNIGDYKQLIDKTFDNVICVEADPSAFSIVIGKPVRFEKTLLDSVNGNWRIVKRAGHIYDKILKCAEDNDIKDFLSKSQFDNNSLFEMCTLAVECFFSSNLVEPVFKNKEFDTTEYRYNLNVKRFGKQTANELHELFVNKKENYAYRTYVESLIESMRNNDYKNFINQIVPVEESNSHLEPILEKEAFYLDDDGFDKYKKTFLSQLRSLNFSEGSQKTILARVLTNYMGSMAKKDEEKIASQVVKTVPTGLRDDFMDSLFPGPLPKNSRLYNFRERLSVLFSNKEEKELGKDIAEVFETKDYSRLSSLLFENRYSDSPEKYAILRHLSKKDFYLPDLSKEIDYSKWHFCHEVASFVKQTEYQDIFIHALEKQCKKSSSQSLRRRCNALIDGFYDVDMDFTKILARKKLVKVRVKK